MSITDRPVRIAIIGTSHRSDYMYAPLLKDFGHDTEFVGVWGRSEASAKRLGENHGVPWYTDLDKLIREKAPDIGIVSVAYGANGQAGLLAVEHGLNVLVETPIAHDLAEADAIIAAAKKRNLKIEVAEQFHRRPLEQIKLKLIASGLFGRVHSSIADFAGHGYHGVSVMRSYLGFDQRPEKVVGAVRKYDLQPHGAQDTGPDAIKSETQEHAIVHYPSGQLGMFHWSNIGYSSPMRAWWRSGRFLAERGACVTVGTGPNEQVYMSLIAPGGQGARFITIERRWERIDGGALVSMVAHTGDPDKPIVQWDNPFKPTRPGAGPQWHDDEIAVADCLLSLVNAVRNDTEPTYGPWQGRLDQEITLAYCRSSELGGEPVVLGPDPSKGA